MKIGNVLRYCQRLNEAVRRGKVNIQNLIALLKNYKGPDISLDQYNKISYALNTSSKYITDLLGKLEVAGISKKVNPDVYKILWRLLVYRGHEYNNFKSLNRLVSDRNRNGLKINEIPVCKPFSLIELAGKKLTTEDGEPNYVLASELANITGQTKGTSRGKCEVLLGIVSRNGNIAAQSHSDEGKGDVIVDRVPIEVKCSKVQGKKLTVSSVAGSSGVLGVTNRFGYRGIIDVRKGLMTIFRDYYNGLKKYVVKVNPMALLKALPDTFALKNAGGNFLDSYLLAPLASLSIKDQAGLRKHVIDTYKAIFLNFFAEDSLVKMTKMIPPVIDANVRGRNLNKMISDGSVVSPAAYETDFIRELGCCWIKLYQSIETFRGLLVASVQGDEEEGSILKDKSVFLNDKVLAMKPLEMANKIKNTGIQFVWPRLDKSSRAPIIGIIIV